MKNNEKFLNQGRKLVIRIHVSIKVLKISVSVRKIHLCRLVKFKTGIDNKVFAFFADASSPTSSRNAVLIQIWIAKADRTFNFDLFAKFWWTVRVEILESERLEVERNRVV